MRSAFFPTSSEPISPSRPRQRAPVIVAIRSTSQEFSAAAFMLRSLPSSEATFISSNMSRLLFSFSPSVPMPTATPGLEHILDPRDAARELHVADRIVRDADAAFGEQRDLGVIEPHRVRDHRLADVEEAQALERLHWTQAVALLHLRHFDFVFARMGVKSGTDSAGQDRSRGAGRPRRHRTDVRARPRHRSGRRPCRATVSSIRSLSSSVSK